MTYGVIAMVILVLVLWYVLNHTAWGRHVYAVGDDPEAAKLSGIQTKRVLIAVYVAVGADLRVRRLGAIGRIGSVSPPPGQFADYRISGHHRGGDRRHIAVRRARLDPRHAVRRDDRRRRLAGLEHARRRPAVEGIF